MSSNKTFEKLYIKVQLGRNNGLKLGIPKGRGNSILDVALSSIYEVCVVFVNQSDHKESGVKTFLLLSYMDGNYFTSS